MKQYRGRRCQRSETAPVSMRWIHFGLLQSIQVHFATIWTRRESHRTVRNANIPRYFRPMRQRESWEHSQSKNVDALDLICVPDSVLRSTHRTGTEIEMDSLFVSIVHYWQIIVRITFQCRWEMPFSRSTLTTSSQFHRALHMRISHFRIAKLRNSWK